MRYQALTTRSRVLAHVITLLSVTCCASLHATEATVIEAGVGASDLTASEPDTAPPDAYPNWSSQYLRGWHSPSTSDALVAEVVHATEFNDTGTFVGIGDTHTFNEDWYASLATGMSDGGVFFPKLRADGFINKKWGPAKNLISVVGLSYYQAKDEHRDRGYSLGFVYYAEAPFTVEGAVRWNTSTPGDVTSRNQFIAVTQGRNKQHYITLRVQSGIEAYQAIGADTALVNFSSHEYSLSWRQWLSEKYGLTLVGEHYINPSYKRSGASLGVFREF